MSSTVLVRPAFCHWCLPNGFYELVFMAPILELMFQRRCVTTVSALMKFRVMYLRRDGASHLSAAPSPSSRLD